MPDSDPEPLVELTNLHSPLLQSSAMTMRNSISRPVSVAFGKGSGRARGALRPMGDLGGRRLSSVRRNARAAGVAPTLTPY